MKLRVNCVYMCCTENYITLRKIIAKHKDFKNSREKYWYEYQTIYCFGKKNTFYEVGSKGRMASLDFFVTCIRVSKNLTPEQIQEKYPELFL